MCLDSKKQKILSALAIKPSMAIRCHEWAGYPMTEYEKNPSSYRTVFMSDRDRILYSKSFLRLSGKTQVYTSNSGDHQRTRLTHTLEVAQIARTISQALNLNGDLTEAIALGHDIGHTPFGHAGEQILHEIMSPKNPYNYNAPKNTEIYFLKEEEINTYRPLYGFKHNLQSVRCLVEDLDSKQNLYGLNLTNYTLWGIAHHSSLEYKNDRVKTDNLAVPFYEKYERFCKIGIGQDAWSFEALVVAEADEIAQMHHDLEDTIRKKAVTKEKIISILKKLWNLMDFADRSAIEKLEKSKWLPREHLISKTSKIIVNTLVNTLLAASHENLYNLLEKYRSKELKDNADEEEIMKAYNKSAQEIFKKCFKDPEIDNAISYDTYGNTEKADMIKDFQKIISKAVLNTYDVQVSDSKGKYIIKNLFEAYNTNPQQLPDSALKNLYKILKEDGFTFKEHIIKTDDQDFFDIESDELREVISDAVSKIRGNNAKKEVDKRRNILIMRVICDYSHPT
ncbi:MAG: dNTP triphosphohydrolase [Ruminococcus sp.]|nr:dNTP triphosphohydrolase [Ruminococcus sp.]